MRSKREIIGIKILLCSLLAFMYIIGGVWAMDNSLSNQVDNVKDSLEEKKEKIDEVKTIIGDVSSGEYLKREWSKALEGTWIGKILEEIEKFFVFINPFLEPSLGISFSFSTLFFLVLMFWVVLLHFSFNILKILKVYISGDNEGYYRGGAFVVIFVIFSSIRIPRFFAENIIEVISKIDFFAVQVILIVAVFVILSFMFKYSRAIGNGFTTKARNIQVKENTEVVKKLKKRAEKIDKSKSKKDEDEEAEKSIDEEARETIEGITEN